MGVLIKVICLLPLFFVPSFGTFFPLFDPFGLFHRPHFRDYDDSTITNNNQVDTSVPSKDIDMESYVGRWELHSESAGVSAMHLVLLPNTNLAVMFDAAILGPSKVQTDTWCSSGGLMVDGTLLQSGGNDDGGRALRYLAPDVNADWREYRVGLSGQRWYGTQATMADGKFVVVGGRRMFSYEFIPREGQANKNNMPLPFLRETTDMFENNLYPFVFLAPDGNLFIFANNRSIIHNPYKNKIIKEFPVLPGGSRNYPASGMAALLPIQLQPGMEANQARVEVLICGGNVNNADEMAEKHKTFVPALTSCGRMEITAEDPKWVMEQMPSPRTMGDMLNLPTGEMLIINGAKIGVAGWGLADDPNFAPVIYRPNNDVNDRFRELAPSTIPRMYHSTSAVLPTGEILVAGSNTNSRYTFEGVKYPTELRVEKFYPHYLDAALDSKRCQIDVQATENSVTYGQQFPITFTLNDLDLRKDDIKVVFYSPPFTTHGFSQNQRMLVLGQTDLREAGVGRFTIEVETPKAAELAQQGYYMMYVVYRGVPSQSSMWVQIK